MQTKPLVEIEVKAIVDKTYANIPPKTTQSSPKNVQTSTHIYLVNGKL